jgi:hypothetical protein
VATEYLIWLRTLKPNSKLVLIWDVFSAHRDKKVKERATALKIRLIFIPPGMTDKLQPLDRWIFGNLKQRAKSRAIHAYGGEASLFQAMMQTRATMTEDEALDAWDRLHEDS